MFLKKLCSLRRFPALNYLRPILSYTLKYQFCSSNSSIFSKSHIDMKQIQNSDLKYESSQDLEMVLDSCNYLINLPYKVLEGSCTIFYEEFFPASSQHNRIIPKIAQLIEENEDSFESTSYQQVLDEQGYYKLAEVIYDEILMIIDFLDKANIGFLTGDIHPFTINIVAKILQNREDDPIESNDKIYENLKKNIFTVGKQFKLPLHGIKSPLEENPRNLFERQLILEQESNVIALDKFNQVFQELNQMNLSHNLQAAQKYVVEWFPQLCKVIQKEQEHLINTEEKQIYGNYLCKISADKLAVIALSELIKAIIQQTTRFREEEIKIGRNQIYVNTLCKDIGSQINRQFIFEQEEETILKMRKIELSKVKDQKDLNESEKHKMITKILKHTQKKQ